jgi:hypothetical protein
VTPPKNINIAVIVEGDGEDLSVGPLLRRLWQELLGGDYANVLRPIRRPRGSLFKAGNPDLGNAVNLAFEKLKDHGGGLILILVDAEEDCLRIANLGPTILSRARAARADADIACVIANVMYETWFVAAADSLRKYLDPGPAAALPDDPEGKRLGKPWIKRHTINGKYSETADQPRFTAAMDLALCRSKSPSFDKLCRELEKRIVVSG